MSSLSEESRTPFTENCRGSVIASCGQVLAGNVNNWTADWYWAEFGHYCVERRLLRDPCLDEVLRQQLGAGAITDKADRGGGFATPMAFHEVLICTRKVHWPPQAREPWNGFRTAKSAT